MVVMTVELLAYEKVESLVIFVVAGMA